MFFKHRPVVNGKKLKSAIMTGNGMKKYVPYIWVDPEEFFVKSENEPGIYEDFNSSDNDFLIYDINNAKLTEEENINVTIKTISGDAQITARADGGQIYTKRSKSLTMNVKPGSTISCSVQLGSFYASQTFEVHYSTSKYIIPFTQYYFRPLQQNPSLILNGNNYIFNSGSSHLLEIIEALYNANEEVEIQITVRQRVNQIYYDPQTQTTTTRPLTTTNTYVSSLKKEELKYFNGSFFDYTKDMFSAGGDRVYFIGRQGASLLGIQPGIYTKYISSENNETYQIIEVIEIERL